MNNIKTRPVSDISEEFTLTAYSEKISAMLAIAHFTLSDAGMVYIEPSEGNHAFYKGLGLDETGNGFELNLNFTPALTIAKAFGLPADDIAIRSLISNLDEGVSGKGYAILQLATKQIPGQAGRMTRFIKIGSPNKIIGQDDVIDLADAGLINPSKLLVTSVSNNDEMLRRDILLKEGDKIKHGYILTAKEPNNDGIDRLTIHQATMRVIGSMGVCSTDKVYKSCILEDGTPALICENSSKPGLSFTESPQYGRNTYEVDKVLYEAVINSQDIGPRLKKASQNSMAMYHITSALKQAAQDNIGGNLNRPRYTEGPLGVSGSILAGPLAVPSYLTTEAFVLTAKSVVDDMSRQIDRDSKVYGVDLSEAVQKAIIQKIDGQLAKVIVKAYEYRGALMKKAEDHKQLMEAAKKPTRAPREFSVEGLGR